MASLLYRNNVKRADKFSAYMGHAHLKPHERPYARSRAAFEYMYIQQQEAHDC